MKCTRCEHEVLPKDEFLATFGDPDHWWQSDDSVLKVTKSESGEVYPLVGDNHQEVWIPGAGRVGLWDDAPVVEVRRWVKEKVDAICVHCFKPHTLEDSNHE